MKTHFAKNKGLFFLLCLWTLSVVIVNPLGEFPLADDWAYLDMLKLFCEKHILFYSDFISTTIIAQLVWAMGFCKLFGFSVFVARISTLVTSFFIIIALYSLLNKLTANRNFSLLCTAIFIFNPILYVQSFTFMTESSLNLMMILCFAISFSWLQTWRWKWILLLALCASIAVLIKQPALIAPVALAIVILFNRNIRYKYFFATLLALCVAVFAYAYFMHWVNSTYGHPGRIVNQINRDVLEYFQIGYHRAFVPQLNNFLMVVMYCGMFLIPVIPILFIYSKNYLNNGSGYRYKKKFFLLFILSIAALSFFATKNLQVPGMGNIFYNTGLGPVVLPDMFDSELHPHSYHAAPLFWRTLSFVSMFTGLYVVVLFTTKFVFTFRKSLRKKTDTADVFYQHLFCSALIYVFLLVNVFMFDRYLLILIPMLVMMMAVLLKDSFHMIKRKWYFISVFILIPVIFFDVTATHDYLSWNRVRWQALNYLTDDLKISPKEIDGGYEFNGTKLYTDNFYPTKGKSWWWVYDDKYMLTMNPVPGYRKFFDAPYFSWLNRKTYSIHVLKRIE